MAHLRRCGAGDKCSARPSGTHIVSGRVYPGLCPGLNSSPSHSGLSEEERSTESVGSVGVTGGSCRGPSTPQAAHRDGAGEKAACFGRDDRRGEEKRKADPSHRSQEARASSPRGSGQAG